ncbi:MAG TPA: hypothetical protein EYN69_10250 [Flavobacteriales bacterium]|nr:hypothetical protein [Flavobacteriales bacterium]
MKRADQIRCLSILKDGMVIPPARYGDIKERILNDEEWVHKENFIEDLHGFYELKNDGILTEEEFDIEKRYILDKIQRMIPILNLDK